MLSPGSQFYTTPQDYTFKQSDGSAPDIQISQRVFLRHRYSYYCGTEI
jgi:hypothetical protein